jgi:predicted unusual protein kinase regulating ubiquinone biosynthesis (AarF/ABC1/UbiB family)
MSLSVHLKHAGRLAEIARLLVKYGRGDLVKHAGLGDLVTESRASPDSGADPQQLARDLEALGPTFIKLGQMLSTRADMIPLAYVEALSKLQDDVGAFPYEEAAAIIEEELGGRIAKLFVSFDREPIASASLGQVHHGVLRDGREVAVKVQRPGVRERVAGDLEILEELARFVDAHTDVGRRFQFVAILAQFRDSLVREMDYRQEARNLTTLGRNLADFPLIVVPAPVAGYTTSRVLTMDFVRGTKITKVSPLRRVELDGTALAEELFRAYLQQVLVDGFFHADPHPGNVFLTEDGRVALIDLGMVAHVSPHVRDQLLKLMIAIGNGWGDEVADIASQMGEELPSFDREATRRDIAGLVAWSEGLTVADMDVGRVLLEITRSCSGNGLRMPPDFAMLGKTMLNLDRVGHALDPDFDPNACLRRSVGLIAGRRVREAGSAQHFLGSIVDARDFLKALPGRANKILDKLANNELKLTVEAIDEDRLISGLQKIANRITLGLLIASLVVGAALIMRVPTTWQVFGYPGLGILLFLAAALGAGWLAVHILVHDGKHRKGT